MLFFIDESGCDEKLAPYMVLAALSIEECVLWEVIQNVHQLELAYFGTRLGKNKAELKGKKLLSSKRFSFARQVCEIDESEYPKLASQLFENSKQPTFKQLTALGRASVGFVVELILLLQQNDVRLFASMVEPAAPRPDNPNMLRKDYVYLFQRMCNFLQSRAGEHTNDQGLIVFDELEKAQARLLINQVENYFTKTDRGRKNSKIIIPEPFFVHSDLTTMVQLVDICAYALNWGFRKARGMVKETRSDLRSIAELLDKIQYSRKPSNGIGSNEFGITYLNDLRGRFD